MGSPWGAWDDMPPLVDSTSMNPQVSRSIPPPLGAAIMPSGGPPHTAPPTSSPFPWGSPFPQPNYRFPSAQDPFAAWGQWSNTTGYPQQSGPSPYIPRQPLHPETQSHDQPRRTHSLPNTQPSSRRKNSVHVHTPWPSQGDLSPLDFPTRMPDVPPRMPDIPTRMQNVQGFTPRALDMHTPSSSLSYSISSGSSAPHSTYHERPQEWRHDFKFKSGFASMFRSRSNSSRGLDGASVVDSAKLDLHPYLRYSKSRPMTIYDLRREALTLVFRELDRPPLANDMDHSVTRPITHYMRIYHPRLPWYIEIRADGAPYISLADFFQQLFAALNRPISKHDFYNYDLDDEDRDILTRTYLERCRSETEKMEGVKRVDFLRGKFEWMGLMPGKNGMWRLKTG